ncbi:hypothetical protein scyTo_0017462 [Scyliorhinus torazame]|uniref:Uncharacterized protein n=1 Tax=Scyliorhinus torazame TaxID=75743 RepID=A0A401PTD9_SCYTO|nr:hypothetical protein [Scyliorhinus torazame]
MLAAPGLRDREATPGPLREDAERRNKFNLNIKMLTDDMVRPFYVSVISLCFTVVTELQFDFAAQIECLLILD